MSNKLHDEPSEVTVEGGEVQLDGPGGVAVSLTAHAAAETSDRLHQAAVEALDQKREQPRSEDQ